MRSINRLSAFRLALLVGFGTQLLLIVFVTAIGLRQLGVTTHNLNLVVDVHMRKQNLTKTMVVAVRERTMLILLLSKTRTSLERIRLVDQFHKNGAEFGNARLEFKALPLSNRERELLELQGQMTDIAQPIQLQVLDLIDAGFTEEAKNLLVKKGIPAQNNVISAISHLDAETQSAALAASHKARADLDSARIWLYMLSGIALLVGMLVAILVLKYTNRANREREQLATRDTLTGLPNRMMFMDRLEQSLIRARRNQSLVGVMFIDLDRFKRVNDTLGHAIGDQLICEVAQRLRSTARAQDIVARLGGDEFVVVISDVNEVKQILHVVEKMLLAVATPCQLGERELFSSCSIGISVFPNDGIDSGSLLKNADTAMYHAKNSGRNRFQLYNAAMNALAEERLQLETDLHHALERNEFVYHYQPQVSLETGRVLGVEALIRWNHPDKGLLSPDAFLDMLEETDEIINVGRRLMEMACRQTASWHIAGFNDLEIAINLSSKEFWHPELIPSIQFALAESSLPPGALQFELTESIFMEDVDAAVRRILELKALGVSVAVDDFGTGYSSLAHLKRFPVDVLKIDRYFIKEIEHDPVNKAMVSAILTLSKDLNLKNVAEGIETQAQLECLRKMGCPIVQGYLISQPVPARQITAMLSYDWSSVLSPAPPVQVKFNVR